MPGSSKACRLFKKTVQQGRSERRSESYFVPYVEPLSDARTMLAGFYDNLLETELLAQILIECHGIVTGLVLGAIQQRHPALSSLPEQLIHDRGDTI